MRTRLFIAALVLASGLAFAQSGTLQIAVDQAPVGLDPDIVTAFSSFAVVNEIYEGLLEVNADLKLQPALATDGTVSPDGLTYVFTLRQGVKFHDGSTLSADDVVYTINMAANPESKVATPSNYAWIDKAEKTGDWTVRIKMKKPTPAALEYLAMVTPIHPKAYREKVGPEGFAAKPVGAALTKSP